MSSGYFISDHPLIQHKITRMRDKNAEPKLFRSSSMKLHHY